MAEQKWADYTPASFVEAGGVKVAYRRKGHGETLLFLHGAGLTRRWVPFYEELSKHCDLIAPEHPGFGDTPLPDWFSDFTDMAVHYADVLKAFELDKVHVVGMSLGGWIAAEFAAIYPEKVRSLSLIAPMGLRPPADVKTLNMFRVGPEEGMNALMGGDAERFLPYFDEGDPGAAAIQGYIEVTTMAKLTWNPRYSLKLEHRLSRVKAPTQIILPEHDAVVPLEVGKRYVELIAGAKLATVAGQGTRTEHGFFLQEPKRLAAQVAALIKG